MRTPGLPERLSGVPRSDAELRALLRRDLQTAPGAGTASVLKKAAVTVAAIGLLVSLVLLYASFWFQTHFNALVRFPFVWGSLLGGLLLGAASVYVLAARR